MPVRRDQPEELVGLALDKEAEQPWVVIVGADDGLEGDRIEVGAGTHGLQIDGPVLLE